MIATLTDEQAHFFLEANYGVVGTVNADGSPQLSTVWFDWDGECVLVNTAAGRAKPRNVARGSKVSVLVFDGDDFNRWLSVVGPPRLSRTARASMPTSSTRAASASAAPTRG